MNAYLKLICLTLGSPSSLHHVGENDYLITAGYIFTSTKTEPPNVKTCLQPCTKKTSLWKRISFFVLVLFSFCSYICAFFIVKRTFLISAVQVIKIISRSFSLFVFRKTSNIKTDYKAVYKISTCKFFSWKNSKTSTQLALTLRSHPLGCFFF